MNYPMKLIAKILAVSLAVHCSALVAAETSILLMGKEQTKNGELTSARGEARAILKGTTENTTVTADEITYDAQRNVLVCAGDSIVTSGGRTLKGKDITIELEAGTKRVVVLARGRIYLSSGMPLLDPPRGNTQVVPFLTDQSRR
jgi:lipopolysaccharide export system protein LptA